MTPPTSIPTLAKRLLIFQKTKDINTHASVFKLVNVSGLPISGPIPPMPSILELPLRLLKALTEFLNLKFRGWALLGAAPYNDISEEGKFFAVIVEQIRELQQQQQQPVPERR